MEGGVSGWGMMTRGGVMLGWAGGVGVVCTTQPLH